MTKALIENEAEIFEAYVSPFCVITDDQMRRYGGSTRMRMTRGTDICPDSENDNVFAQSQNMGFPLVEDVVVIADNDKDPVKTLVDHSKAFFMGLMRQALFGNKSNLNYIDEYYNYLNLPIRPLINADGQSIPLAPDGMDFDAATHDHYSALPEGFTIENVRSVFNNVVEHCSVGDLQIYINRNDVEALFDMNPAAFFYYLRPGISADKEAVKKEYLKEIIKLAPDAVLAVGRFDAAEVIIWDVVPEGHLLVIDTGAPGYRPLVLRVHSDHGTRYYEGKVEGGTLYRRLIGVAVWHRHMAACGQVGVEKYSWEDANLPLTAVMA